MTKLNILSWSVRYVNWIRILLLFLKPLNFTIEVPLLLTSKRHLVCSLPVLKGLQAFFYWDFRGKISTDMTRFCLDLTYFGFSKNAFSQRYIHNSTTLSQNNWNVSFPLRKIRQLSVMSTNFGIPTNSPNFALFCFIEGIPIIFKFQQVKFLQIEGRFVRTPHKQLKWKSRIFSKWQNASNCNEIWFVLMALDLRCDQLKSSHFNQT